MRLGWETIKTLLNRFLFLEVLLLFLLLRVADL